MKTTLTAARVAYLQSLNLKNAIAQTTGPRGGVKYLNVSGTPSAGWTRAAHLAGLTSVPVWSGHAPTPSRAFGYDVYAAMVAAPADLVNAR